MGSALVLINYYLFYRDASSKERENGDKVVFKTNVIIYQLHLLRKESFSLHT